MENDSAFIARYSDTAYVPGGWSPEMKPLVLVKPQSAEVAEGGEVLFRAEVA
jgi:hypothetical protein